MSPAEPAFPTLLRFRRAAPGWHVALGSGVVFIGWLLTAPEKTPAMRLFSVGFLAAMNLVVAAAFRRAGRRTELPGGLRKALVFFAAGIAMTGLGGVCLLIEVLVRNGDPGTFSAADALFLLSYPLMLIGLARLPRGERRVAGRGRIAIDGAAIVVGVGIPLWLGAVGPAWREAAGMNAVLVVVWPGCAFLGLVAMNAALLTRAPLPTRGALWLVLASFGLSWLADLIFSLDASVFVVHRQPVNWINVTNAASLCLGLVAAWRFSSDPLPARPRMRPATVSPVPMATMIIVASWLTVLSLANQSGPQMERKILPGLIMLFLVLFLRETLGLVDMVRWMALESQRDSQARIEAMVRHASDVMMVVDAPFRIQFASPSLLAALGLPVAEVLGQSLLQFAHAEDVSRGEQFLSGLRQDPATVTHLRWRLRHADGTFRHFETAGSNAFGESTVGGLVLNSRDVSERTVLEAELRQAHKLQAVGQLVGGIAHNFNNILASTFLRLELLRKARKLPQELNGEVAELELEAKRSAELIRQLQLFGQAHHLCRKRLDLGATLADLQPVLSRLVGDRIELVLLDDARPKWIEADGMLVNQVILNLCANARDAMPQGGRLSIELQHAEWEAGSGGGRTERMVCLSFRDTGRGMDELVRSRLFEPFFTTKDAGKGPGLGLAAVHGIVKQHGGRLSVESEVGSGSTFRVFLPAAIEAPRLPGE